MDAIRVLVGSDESDQRREVHVQSLDRMFNLVGQTVVKARQLLVI